MELKIQELKDNYLKMTINGIPPSFVNTIRRVLLADVPKMAIEDVEFHLGPIRDSDGKEYESISPLFDEIIAHRLGLIPIPTDLSIFKYRADCDCEGEGCPNCTIMYNLNKKGPCTVYSGDLEPLGDSKFKIREDLIPLVKLDKNQALLIYATAELGRGKDHAKWQAASGIGYKNFPIINIDQKLCKDPEACGTRCIASCPRDILELKNKKVVLKKPVEECILCNSCMEVCNKNEENEDESTEPAIKIDCDESKFIFKFETDGSMTAQEAFKYTLKFLEDKFNDFRDQISSLK
jgi:DNA-directed RNA polymerase subunit D